MQPISDPITKKFLRDHCNPVFGFPQLVRFSWSTATNILDQNAYHVEFEELDEKPDAASANTLKISSYFKSKGKNAEKQKHEFFRQRFLSICTEL